MIKLQSLKEIFQIKEERRELLTDARCFKLKQTKSKIFIMISQFRQSKYYVINQTTKVCMKLIRNSVKSKKQQVINDQCQGSVHRFFICLSRMSQKKEFSSFSAYIMWFKSNESKGLKFSSLPLQKRTVDMNSSRENLKVSNEKKNLSSSSSKKAGEISMGRKKTTAVGVKTLRQDHSNKSKVSDTGPRKKVTSTSGKKDIVGGVQPTKQKEPKEVGFKNIKKKVIGTPGLINDKENGKQNTQSKKEIEQSAALKPKGLNTSTPRTNSSVFTKSVHQKTEGDEKPRSVKKSELITKHKSKASQDLKELVREPENKRRFTLEDFQIGKKLGKGRFGDVFLVKEKRIGLIMAMKVINKKELKESEMEGQLMFEIKIQTFLNHPNALKMYGYFSDNKNVYLLLELAAGGCLFRQLKTKNCFKEDQAAYYLRQIVTGLKCMHSNYIMHRDIKPENILNSFGVLKLCDFGWAVYSPLYQRQTFCGTLDYVPPEIVKGDYYDEKVDIWCIGILCYELCTGHAPFEAKDNELETYDKILSLDLAFPQGLSQEVVDFISRLLIKDPKQRMTFEQIENHPWMRKHENESGRLISKQIWEMWHELKSS